MSISPPVGALQPLPGPARERPVLRAAKNVGKTVLRPVPPLLELAKRFEQQARAWWCQPRCFEKFGFNYIGPIDGHDLDSLIPTLENIKGASITGLVPVVVTKRAGLQAGRGGPVAYHGPASSTRRRPGQKARLHPSKPSPRCFGQWLCDMAAQDGRLVGITPAMREGSGMVEFEKRFPDRYYDVGIAEQHAVTFAAGMACEGA